VVLVFFNRVLAPAGLEFKAGLEKSLNFRKLKKSLNCFGKRMESLEKFGICLS